MEKNTRGLRDVVSRCTVLMGLLSFLLRVRLLWSGRRSRHRPGRVLRAQDPGVRGGSAAAGGPLAGITDCENEYFLAGKGEFEEAEEVSEGLGPTMNPDRCGGCHSQPAIGGSSPRTTRSRVCDGYGGRDLVPPFLVP